MEKRPQWKVAMTYGAMYGLASSIIYLIFDFSGAAFDNPAPKWIGYLILIIAICMGIVNYRNNEMGGYIKYSRSLGTGVLIGLFGGIVTGIFTVIMFTVIDPELAQKIAEKTQEDMVEKGMSEDQISMAVSWTQKLMHPALLFIFSILSGAFMAFIFSLIISVFTKKEQSPFQG